jgi:hypothetical protein
MRERTKLIYRALNPIYILFRAPTPRPRRNVRPSHRRIEAAPVDDFLQSQWDGIAKAVAEKVRADVLVARLSCCRGFIFEPAEEYSSTILPASGRTQGCQKTCTRRSPRSAQLQKPIWPADWRRSARVVQRVSSGHMTAIFMGLHIASAMGRLLGALASTYTVIG